MGQPRLAVSGIVASLLLGTASAAAAQQAPPPTPPQPDTTTVVEPKPEPPPPPPEPTAKQQGPAHVPPDASGIDLTTLETKDLDLLYFDPVQT
jgi:hypothetical protein